MKTYKEKIKELRIKFSESGSTREWTEEEIEKVCVSMIHSGIYKLDWNANIK